MKANIPQETYEEYAAYDRNTGKVLRKRGVCRIDIPEWFPTYKEAEFVLEQWLKLLPEDHILTIIKKEVTNNYTDTMPD
ncbi:MAG: hypothetical protein IK038_02220 [Bacteroidaceae bacterium]|nr:hypothetical protein [Bacteroidaceae bacterium]